MGKFLAKRVVLAVVTLWAIVSLTFVLMNAAPGNPFRQEGKMPEVVYQNLLKEYGLDKPKGEQYLRYIKNVSQGNFGASMKSNVETVNQMIGRGAPVSARLGLQAFVIALTFGPLLGSLAALHQNKFPDYVSMVVALIGISVPSFILGTFLIQFIAKPISWLPIGGWGEFKHTILPSLALSLMPLASTARLMRSSMLEVLGQDYIKTAKSKGIRKNLVILRHAVRNAILPIVSSMGTTLSGLLTGSFVIEKIFGIPGLGNFFVKSIVDRDYTLIMGTTVFYSIVLIAMLLLVDVLYVVIDPRIKLTRGAE